MGTCERRVAGDRLTVHPYPAAGLADPTALSNMAQHRYHLGLRQPGLEERRALALGEARVAGSAVQQPQPLVLTVVHADGQVTCPPFAVVGTPGPLTAKSCEVVHGLPSSPFLY